MRYQNKPSEKIIGTESNGSIKLNSPLSHTDGHIDGRLFFAPSRVSQSYISHDSLSRSPASRVKKFQSMNNF